MSEEEQELRELIATLEFAFSTVDSEKTEESIRIARKRWEECLKEANGDLKKARKFYDNI